MVVRFHLFAFGQLIWSPTSYFGKITKSIFSLASIHFPYCICTFSIIDCFSEWMHPWFYGLAGLGRLPVTQEIESSSLSRTVPFRGKTIIN